MRVFIGIEFDSNVKTYLREVQSSLKPQVVKGEFTRFDNFHLTLKYIGHVTRNELSLVQDIVDHVATLHKSFHIKLGDVDAFKKRNSSIVWVGVTEGKKQLHRVFDTLEQVLVHEGFNEEGRTYRPHVTIGKKMVFNLEKGTRILPLYVDVIKVDKITVFESHRVDNELVYTPIYRVDLG